MNPDARALLERLVGRVDDGDSVVGLLCMGEGSTVHLVYSGEVSDDLMATILNAARAQVEKRKRVLQ